MKRLYRPTKGAGDWCDLTAGRGRQWKAERSARLLAETWEAADGFPRSVKRALKGSDAEVLRRAEMLAGFPEYTVSLPGRGHPSQNDLFVLARSPSLRVAGPAQLIAVMVEGKVDEPFGETVAAWSADMSPGKIKRLAWLRETLHLDANDLGQMRYQLLHRTASVIVEARRFAAGAALMLVHSFSPSAASFDDFLRLLDLYQLQGAVGEISGPVTLDGIDMYFGWVQEP